MLTKLTCNPILQKYKPKKKSRQAVAKVRRSTLDGSHSGHPAISTEESPETDDGTSSRGAGHWVEPSEQPDKDGEAPSVVRADPNNTSHGESSKNVTPPPDDLVQQLPLDETHQPNNGPAAELVVGARQLNIDPIAETLIGTEPLAPTTEHTQTDPPSQDAQAAQQ